MPIKYLCAYPACQTLVDERGTCCDNHIAYGQARAERKKQFQERGFVVRNTAQHTANQQLYRSKVWKQVRSMALLRDGYTCKVCGREATTVDHIKPHEGNLQLFLDMNNLQSLCASCHGIKSYRESCRKRQ